MNNAYEIRVVGPQFSEPSVFLRWLHNTYGGSVATVKIGEHDGCYETILPGEPAVRVLVARPACWDIKTVYSTLLSDGDAVLLMLNRIASLTRLNAEVVDLVRPAVKRLGVTPVVIANDPHGGSEKFPSQSVDAIRQELALPWTIRETTIGPFEQLRWSAGAAEAWQDVMQAAARHRATLNQ